MKYSDTAEKQLSIIDTYIDSVAGIGLGLEDAARLLARRWAAKEENQ